MFGSTKNSVCFVGPFETFVCESWVTRPYHCQGFVCSFKFDLALKAFRNSLRVQKSAPSSLFFSNRKPFLARIPGLGCRLHQIKKCWKTSVFRTENVYTETHVFSSNGMNYAFCAWGSWKAVFFEQKTCPDKKYFPNVQTLANNKSSKRHILSGLRGVVYNSKWRTAQKSRFSNRKSPKMQISVLDVSKFCLKGLQFETVQFKRSWFGGCKIQNSSEA